MDEENNQNQQEQELPDKLANQEKDAIKDAARNAAKEKMKNTKIAKAVIAVVQAIIHAIMPIIIIMLIVSLVSGFFVAIISTIGEKISNIKIAIKFDDKGPLLPTKKEMLASIEEELKNLGISKTSLDMGSKWQAEAYLYKFKLTELATQLPYLNDDLGKIIFDIVTSGSFVLQNFIDEQINVQGIVKIKKRTAEGDIQDLDFKKYEKFSELIQNNNTSALKYFSIDDDWNLCIAKKTTVTVNGSATVTLEEVKLPYKTMIANYTVPFSFLMQLQLVTHNPEYVSAVADLVNDEGEIELTIFEAKQTTTTNTTTSYELNTKFPPKDSSEESSALDGLDTSALEGIQKKDPLEGIDTSIFDENNNAANDDGTITQRQTETTTTVVETTTITADVTKANVWAISKDATYSIDEQPSPTDTQTVPGRNEQEPEEFTTTQIQDKEVEMKTWVTNESTTIDETTVTKNWIQEESNTQVEPSKFLGLWKNKTGLAIPGLKYDPKGIVVMYGIPQSLRTSAPVENIITGEGVLYYTLSKNEETQLHAQIMRELIKYYKATGKGEDYTINVDFSLFDTSTFSEATYGSSTAKDFIHYFEGKPKETEDGTKYVVFNDGADNRTAGWGINIEANLKRFSIRKINTDSITFGSTIDKTLVDSIEDEIIEEYRLYVEDVTRGLDLKEYQIDALVSRLYNCGYGGLTGFVTAYKKYGDTDELYNNFLNKPVVNNKGEYMAGLEKRRKLEWRLFHEGYYANTDSYWTEQTADANVILQTAKKCHDYLRNNKFVYAQAGQNIPITSKSRKTIDCSSFVSWVLYEAGYKQFAGHQKVSGDFKKNPMNWQKISKGNLQPGDIMVFSGHVQIYAGNGKYYNCGTNSSIQTEAPSTKGLSENSSTFLFGLRPNN